MTAPIELYYWPTPNGWKVSIALEEMGLPYVVRPVNIGTGEQFEPAFLKISPNNRMPAIIDPDDPYAQANIARIDSVAGNIDAARARLNAADKKRPASLQLALARVDVELVAKNPAGMLSAIRQAQSLAVPKSELPFLYSRLADAHLM